MGQVTEINCQTGEQTVRDMTDEENNAMQSAIQQQQQMQAAAKAEQDTRNTLIQSAQSKLTALGLTTDEVNALLGTAPSTPATSN
jgi:hypothetical protein